MNLGAPSASMGPSTMSATNGVASRLVLMSQQLPERRLATMTQNPNATQFQEVWAGMTQWAEIAGAKQRFSAQTTRFFCSAEPHELLPELVRLLEREKAQTSVYALHPTHGHERHITDMDHLIEGFNSLTQEAQWAPAAVRDADAEEEDEHEDEDSMMLDGEDSGAGRRRGGAQDRPAGARLHIALSDKRKCPLAGNIWIDALPLGRRPSPISVNGSMKQIKSLVLLSRSSGSPLEWRRLFASIVRDATLKDFVVPM